MPLTAEQIVFECVACGERAWWCASVTQTGRMNRRNRVFTTSEAAWVLAELARATSLLREAGYCTGELRCADVRVSASGISRAGPVGVVTAARHRLAARQHRRRGHDRACALLGMPIITISNLLRGWVGEEAAGLLLDGVEEALEQLASGSWDGVGSDEVLKHVIGSRIAVRAPADHV
jgi:hypothetical protein